MSENLMTVYDRTKTSFDEWLRNFQIA